MSIRSNLTVVAVKHEVVDEEPDLEPENVGPTEVRERHDARVVAVIDKQSNTPEEVHKDSTLR